jgi:CBS domain-containing protein
MATRQRGTRLDADETRKALMDQPELLEKIARQRLKEFDVTARQPTMLSRAVRAGIGLLGRGDTRGWGEQVRYTIEPSADGAVKIEPDEPVEYAAKLMAEKISSGEPVTLGYLKKFMSMVEKYYNSSLEGDGVKERASKKEQIGFTDDSLGVEMRLIFDRHADKVGDSMVYGKFTHIGFYPPAEMSTGELERVDSVTADIAAHSDGKKIRVNECGLRELGSETYEKVAGRMRMSVDELQTALDRPWNVLVKEGCIGDPTGRDAENPLHELINPKTGNPVGSISRTRFLKR